MHRPQSPRRVLRNGAVALCLALSPCLALAQAYPAKTKAQYQKVFAEALSKHLASQKGDNLCLPGVFFRPGGPESIDLNQRQMDMAASMPTGQAAQLKALEEAGLVASTVSERTVNNRQETVRSYRRTELGNRFHADGHFCYARAELNRIVKWKGPAVLGEYRIAWVYYTTKSTKVADWATLPAILAAFPAVKSNLLDEPDKVRQVLVDLSSEGWEVNEWSKVLQ